METPWLWITGVAAVAGFVQGLSGFGFAMVAVSLWAWVLEPRLAVVLAVFGGLVGQAVAAAMGGAGESRGRAGPFLVGGLLGLPIGLWLLPHIDVQMFRAIVGATLVVWCPVMLLAPRLPSIRAGGRFADGLAGAVGGLMASLGGVSGAAPTLWCAIRGYDGHTVRAIIQQFNLTMLAATMTGYALAGVVSMDMLPAMALVVPSLLLPTVLGIKAYGRMTPEAFRTVVMVLLTCAGFALLASASPA